MNKKPIYIVGANRGSHDDYCEWNIQAYLCRGKAQEHADNAQKEAQRIHDLREAENKGYGQYDDPRFVNEYDSVGAGRFNEMPTYTVETLKLII